MNKWHHTYKGIRNKQEVGMSGKILSFEEFSRRGPSKTMNIYNEIFELVPSLLPKVFFYNKKHDISIYIAFDGSPSTYRGYMKANFIPYNFNYNQYWVELNE